MSCFPFGLFSFSPPIPEFDPCISLSENFTRLCSLSRWRRGNSDPSKELISTLALCTLNMHRHGDALETLRADEIAELNVFRKLLSLPAINAARYTDLLPEDKEHLDLYRIKQDCATLSLAKYAITHWIKQRHGKSSRVERVTNLLDNVDLLRAELTRDAAQRDYQVFSRKQRLAIQHRHETRKTNPIAPADIAPMIWTTPNMEADNLKTYLLPPQLSLFERLANLIFGPKQEPLPDQSRVAKLYTAACMPILNYIIDFDGFDLLADYVGSMVDLARIF